MGGWKDEWKDGWVEGRMGEGMDEGEKSERGNDESDLVRRRVREGERRESHGLLIWIALLRTRHSHGR